MIAHALVIAYHSLHDTFALCQSVYVVSIFFIIFLGTTFKSFNVLPSAAGIHCNFAHSQEQIGEETSAISPEVFRVFPQFSFRLCPHQEVLLPPIAEGGVKMKTMMCSWVLNDGWEREVSSG